MKDSDLHMSDKLCKYRTHTCTALSTQFFPHESFRSRAHLTHRPVSARQSTFLLTRVLHQHEVRPSPAPHLPPPGHGPHDQDPQQRCAIERKLRNTPFNALADDDPRL